MKGMKIVYKDIAPYADLDAACVSSDVSDFSDIDQLPFGADMDPVITLEHGQWVLDGTHVPLAGQTPAFWSTQMSGADGTFEAAPVIDITFDAQYSSVGVSFIFDQTNEDYVSKLNIKWYQQDELKADMDFEPDNYLYFCKNQVESWDRIVVTLKETVIPYRYAKLEKIIFGEERTFYRKDLRSAKVVAETGLISDTLPISELKWTVDSVQDVAFLFQLKQPCYVYHGDSLIGCYYIDEFSRKGADLFEIDCYDAIGVLSESDFPGGVYNNQSAVSIIGEIVGDDFTIEYDDGIIDMNLTGIIASGNKRAALQQVLFAWGYCATTDGRDTIRIRQPGVDLSSIGMDKTFTGAKVSTDSVVTSVQVTAHTYTASSSGTVEINGQKYTDTKTVYTVTNPDVTKTDKTNVKKVEKGTLVNPSYAQAVAQRVYDYYQMRNTVKAKIVWSGQQLGDLVSFPNQWGERTSGTISKMEMNLSNTIVATCEAIGVV
jgi:hypothetical protein